jgi:hypothetical protein
MHDFLGLDQPFQWAPPASTSAMSDPMATAILVTIFVVVSFPRHTTRMVGGAKGGLSSP